MNLRTPNEHTEDNEAWKKRNLAFANYYTAHRAYEKVEQDFAASRDAKTRTDKAERDRQKADALANELHKLTTAWTKIDRKLGEEDEFASDSDPAHIAVYGLTKLKEPGDYQDINSGFTVRLGADGTIRPFAQKPNSPGHDHTDPHLNMMGVLKTNWNWESNYNKVFDFAASQCGASSVVIDFESPGRRSLGRMQQLLKMAGDRQLEVKLGPNFVEYLGYLTSNGRGSDAKMAAHIYDLVRQVNAKAEERKKDPEFLNSVESSLLHQYAGDLQGQDNKLAAIADDDENKTMQRTKFEEEISKKKDDRFMYDETLAEIEKQLKGVDDGTGKKTAGFEARARTLAEAEKELSTQLEARTKELEQLTKLETEEAANSNAARREEIEALKERITRLTEGEPGTNKSALREGMITGIETETQDLKVRAEAMASTLEKMKHELEATPENARNEEQKKQLQQVVAFEKTVTTQQKTLQGYMAEGGARSKLAVENEKLVTNVAELKDKGPRLGV